MIDCHWRDNMSLTQTVAEHHQPSAQPSIFRWDFSRFSVAINFHKSSRTLWANTVTRKGPQNVVRQILFLEPLLNHNPLERIFAHFLTLEVTNISFTPLFYFTTCTNPKFGNLYPGL